jgi:phospholipase A1
LLLIPTLLLPLPSLPCAADDGTDATAPVQTDMSTSQQEAEGDNRSATDRKIEEIFESPRNPFYLVPYDQNYITYSYAGNINKELYSQAGVDLADQYDNHEIKFQLSIMIPFWRGLLGKNSALMASYTQLSMWQALNTESSSPFRETDYQPQLFGAWATRMERWGAKLRWIEFGYNHQSNGRSGDISRSWNRIFANFVIERGNFYTSFRPHYRIEESEEDDDNPDIEDYLGRFNLDFAYRWDRHVITLRTRYSFAGGAGSAEMGWSYPLSESVRLYAQLFTGYGDSLIDYNNYQTRIGLGVMLNDLI